MKRSITITLGLIIALFCLKGAALGQEKEGIITIKITKEIDGEKKTFEKTYESEREMLRDSEYREFTGDKRNGFIFKFPDDEDILIDMQHLGEDFIYKLDMDMDHVFQFGMDSLGEEMHEHLERIREEFEDLKIDFDFEHDGEEILHWKHFDGNDHRVIMLNKKVMIEDIKGNEFEGKGKVEKKNTLELEELDFYPNPSKGRVKLKFKMSQEGPLDITVYDLEGKQIYTRSFALFGGTYNEYLDLTGQEEGIYLLEISSGNKRLTKKIIIE